MIPERREDDDEYCPEECARRLQQDGIDVDVATLTVIDGEDTFIRHEKLAELLAVEEDRAGLNVLRHVI